MEHLRILPVLTDEGMVAFANLIETTRTVENASERRAMADAILSDAALCVDHPSGTLIDSALRFDNALDLCEKLHDVLFAIGFEGIVDRGVNAALYLLYIDQLVGSRAKKVASYFMGRHGNSMTRNYRNALYVFFRFYLEHLRNPGSTATILLQNCAPHQITYPLEKLAQQPNIIGAPGAMELVRALMLNEKGKFVRPAKKKTETASVKTEKVLQELSAVVFTQVARNFDVVEMSWKQIFALIPNTDRFKSYKERAKKALGKTSDAEAPSMVA